MAIRHGDGSGLHVTPRAEGFGSPKLMRAGAPHSLNRYHKLLAVTDAAIDHWLEAAGTTDAGVDRGPVLSERSMGTMPLRWRSRIATARSALAA
jgi:hypothetical protein